MRVTSTLRELGTDEARAAYEDGAALVDLRPVDDYLAGHVRESLSLAYERGPGFAGRARDCLPLDLSLILIDDGVGDTVHAAASLRGKGYDVIGIVRRSDLSSRWPSASTETITGEGSPEGFLLDVGDPGTRSVPEAATRIPVDRLWAVAEEIRDEARVVVMAGKGVRAALAVGILEGAGIPQIAFWKTTDRAA